MSLANVRQGTYRDVETFLRLEPGDRQHDPRSRRNVVRWIASPRRGRLVQAVVNHLELRLGQADPLDLKSCECVRDRLTLGGHLCVGQRPVGRAEGETQGQRDVVLAEALGVAVNVEHIRTLQQRLARGRPHAWRAALEERAGGPDRAARGPARRGRSKLRRTDPARVTCRRGRES